MNDHKVLVDQSTEWTIYIGTTKYPRPRYIVEDQWYKNSSDTAEPIWKIKKITEDNWITEISYPNWDYSESFARDNRASYTYK